MRAITKNCLEKAHDFLYTEENTIEQQIEIIAAFPDKESPLMFIEGVNVCNACETWTCGYFLEHIGYGRIDINKGDITNDERRLRAVTAMLTDGTIRYRQTFDPNDQMLPFGIEVYRLSLPNDPVASIWYNSLRELEEAILWIEAVSAAASATAKPL
jgi:hypothetical protein